MVQRCLIYLVNLWPSLDTVIIFYYQQRLWLPLAITRGNVNYLNFTAPTVFKCSFNFKTNKTTTSTRCIDCDVLCVHMFVNDIVCLFLCRLWLGRVRIGSGELWTGPLSRIWRHVVRRRRRRKRPMPLWIQLHECASQPGTTAFKNHLPLAANVVKSSSPLKVKCKNINRTHPAFDIFIGQTPVSYKMTWKIIPEFLSV